VARNTRLGSTDGEPSIPGRWSEEENYRQRERKREKERKKGRRKKEREGGQIWLWRSKIGRTGGT
jgi:hypothetical protein